MECYDINKCIYSNALLNDTSSCFSSVTYLQMIQNHIADDHHYTEDYGAGENFIHEGGITRSEYVI